MKTKRNKALGIHRHKQHIANGMRERMNRFDTQHINSFTCFYIYAVAAVAVAVALLFENGERESERARATTIKIALLQYANVKQINHRNGYALR